MRSFILLASIAVCLTGCRSLGVGGPADFLSPQYTANLDAQTDALFPTLIDADSVRNKTNRNQFITAKMFVIDRSYAIYEPAVARNDSVTKFFGSLATIGMSTAASVIPLGATTKILTSTITAVQGAERAIDQDILQSQAILSITRQMRADRAVQARVIFNRMSACGIDRYPVYIALSDLENYRSAGTFESALASLGRTTALLETAATNYKNSTVTEAPETVLAALIPQGVTTQNNGGGAIKSLNSDQVCPI